MSTTPTPSEYIVQQVTAWPGVEQRPGRFGAWAFVVGGREIGHLHGDGAAHFGFPVEVWRELRAQGRITPHPVFPEREGPAARRIEGEHDVHDVIALLRLNYDRVAQAPARRGANGPAAAGPPSTAT
jgi:hypothetical protein